FFQKVLTAVQNWFSLFGWSKGPNPISIPYSLRRNVHQVQMSSSELFKQNFGKDTVHDMLFHLSGRLLPGVTSSRSLSSNPTRGILQLCWQHSALLDFLESQGALLPHVMPEFLLDPDDYRKWITVETFLKVVCDVTNLKIWSDMHLFMLEKSVFEKMSKRAWTDLLLQVYKILVLPRVSSHNITDLFDSKGMQSMPKIKPEPLSSNIYSTHERIILIWLNKHYEKNRKIVWKDCQKGEIPPMRWIINFDRDLLDGLVLAAQLAAYCPFLVRT
ncbi:CFA47 protein, partial [Nothoprocta ornata]|nr:CFA47 protein [Nothoprocta ornata]